MTNTASYEAASQAHRVASQAFTLIQNAYRAQEIGDDEYLAGRAAFDLATAAYDAAFEIEANRAEDAEDAEAEADEDLQLALAL